MLLFISSSPKFKNLDSTLMLVLYYFYMSPLSNPRPYHWVVRVDHEFILGVCSHEHKYLVWVCTHFRMNKKMLLQASTYSNPWSFNWAYTHVIYTLWPSCDAKAKLVLNVSPAFVMEDFFVQIENGNYFTHNICQHFRGTSHFI